MRITLYTKERGKFSIKKATEECAKWNNFYRDKNQCAHIYINGPGSRSVYIVNQYGIFRGWLR